MNKRPSRFCSTTRIAVLLMLVLLALRCFSLNLNLTALDSANIALVVLTLHHRFWHRRWAYATNSP